MPDVASIGEALQTTAPRFGIRSAALFGSHARGEATEESDVDILIDTDGSFSLLDAARFRNELSEALQADVDVVSRRAISGAFAQNVTIDQVVLYERN